MKLDMALCVLFLCGGGDLLVGSKGKSRGMPPFLGDAPKHTHIINIDPRLINWSSGHTLEALDLFVHASICAKCGEGKPWGDITHERS